MFNNTYKNKKVLITGHTGFKGSWLATWLIQLGAEVIGYSKDIPTTPSHFEALNLKKYIKHYIGDVRNYSNLKSICDIEKPEIVFHLAAQALVRKSYLNPRETVEINTIGVTNVLEVARNTDYIKSLVIITSDKCYNNVEWIYGYREIDMLGGEDPYSASKGCAEIIAKAYMKSFFHEGETFVATTRAGNVIGGGDWAEDRIVPDSVKAWSEGKVVTIRSPRATRPWQHVLEPLSGYLQLGAELYNRNISCKNQAFNFGPNGDVTKTVEALLIEMKKNWDSVVWNIDVPKNNKMKEAGLLKLNCDKASLYLDWNPTMGFEKTVEFTVLWYKNFYVNEKKITILEFTEKQIKEYCELANVKGVKWSL